MNVIDKAKYAHDSLCVLQSLMADLGKSLRPHPSTRKAATKLGKVCKDTRAIIQTLKGRTQ